MPYRMKDERWRAHKMIEGKRRTKVFPRGKKGERDAAAWENAQTPEKWKRQSGQIVSVYSWAEAYLEHVHGRMAPKTFYHKQRAFVRLLKYLKPLDSIPNITTALAFRCISDRANSTTGYAANVDRKNLRAAWEWAKRHMDGWPEMTNPFSTISKFPEQRQPRKVPTEPDFWKAVNIGCTREEDRNFLLLMLYTSCRLGEICRLTWNMVDLPGRRIAVGTRKRTGGGMEYDWLPLVKPAQEILAVLPRDSDLVFPSPDGKAFTARQHIMRKVCKRAGVPPFGFHAIRHLSASILASEGVPLPMIQAILRHKTAQTTSIYLKALGADLPELDRVWEGRKKDVLHTEFAHGKHSQDKDEVIQ